MFTQDILEKAEDFFGNSQKEIVEKVRYTNIIKIRQFIAALANLMGEPDEQIGLVLNVDRTTVINSRRRWQFQCGADPAYAAEFDTFKYFVSPYAKKSSTVKMICFPRQDMYVNMSTHDLIVWEDLAAKHYEMIKKQVLKRLQR